MRVYAFGKNSLLFIGREFVFLYKLQYFFTLFDIDISKYFVIIKIIFFEKVEYEKQTSRSLSARILKA